jgi:hypothetical protein
VKHARTEKTSQPSPELLRLADLPTAELEREFIRGQTPEPDRLAGWDFRGLNHLKATKLVGIRKFVKGFYLQSGELYGYNAVVEQNALTDEWNYKPSADSPKRHGFYRVHEVRADEVDNQHLHALLLDYGQGENPRFDVTRGLRDYLVQVTDDVYLGKAFYALGRRRIELPSMFILDRFRPGMGPTP